MFKIGDYVVYKKDTCLVKNIIDSSFDREKYYVLSPMEDESLTLEVPVSNELCIIKPVISKKEVEELINDIPNIPVITCENEKMIDQEYKRLLYEGNHRDLISIIKTTFARNESRIANKKKIGEKDDAYFKRTEKILYNEFSVALNMSYEETKNYVQNKVEKMTK